MRPCLPAPPNVLPLGLCELVTCGPSGPKASDRGKTDWSAPGWSHSSPNPSWELTGPLPPPTGGGSQELFRNTVLLMNLKKRSA